MQAAWTTRVDEKVPEWAGTSQEPGTPGPPARATSHPEILPAEHADLGNWSPLTSSSFGC